MAWLVLIFLDIIYMRVAAAWFVIAFLSFINNATLERGARAGPEVGSGGRW